MNPATNLFVRQFKIYNLKFTTYMYPENDKKLHKILFFL
jgi:hypothetical protein